MKREYISKIAGKTVFTMLGFALGQFSLGAEMEITLELLDEPIGCL